MKPTIPRWALYAFGLAMTTACGDSNLGGASAGSTVGSSGGGTGTTGSGTTDDGGTDGTTADTGNACGQPVSGAFQDCINGSQSVCENSDSFCLFNRLQDPTWGTCSLACEDECDCPNAHPGGTATVACTVVKQGDEKSCVLDCSQGSCPVGQSCIKVTGEVEICVFEADVEPTTGGDGTDTSGSGTGTTGG